MKLSILGCGWVGLPLAEALVRAGHDVRGSTTRVQKLRELERAKVTPHLLEVTPKLKGDIDGFFDADLIVITLPPRRREAGVKTRYPAQMDEVLRHTPSTTRVIMTSSTSVYPNLNRTVTEDDAGGEISGSGEAILTAEALVHARGGVILRLAGLYGYDRQPARRLSGRTVSGGASPVNLVHRDDSVAALLAVIEQGVRALTLNVCAPHHPSRREVYTRQVERLGLAAPQFIEPDEVPYKLVSSERLEQRCAFTFLHPDPRAEAP